MATLLDWKCPCGALNDGVQCGDCGRERTQAHARPAALAPTYEVREPPPPGMAEAVERHFQALPQPLGPAGRAAHRAWLLEMDARYPGIGWAEEALAWDRWVAKRYPAVAGPARDPGEPAWVREDA